MSKAAWQSINTEEALRLLNTTPSGLSPSVVMERLTAYGRNTLPSRRRLTLFAVVINQFLSPLIYILLVAAVVSILLGEYSDAGFIFIVLLLNAAVGSFQEWKAESRASALEQMIRLKVKARRADRILVVDSEELVPGDIVMLESGNKVPADIRILNENNLHAEEAILTGESMPVVKRSETILPPDAPVSEQVNMLFAGTTITSGRGLGLVVMTGAETEIGRIASSLKELSSGKAPLVQRMETFTRRISVIVLGMSIFLGVLAYFNGISVREIFFFVVAVAVSAIPEGLPVAMTVALSIGSARMARRNVIIRKLTAVEGLGSCTFIATDKTGTLTVDQQTARAIVVPGPVAFRVTGEGYNGTGHIFEESQEKQVNLATSFVLRKVVETTTICNEGDLINENGGWTHAGDPIDVALLCLAYKGGTTPRDLTRDIEIVFEVPFESERRFAATYFRRAGKPELNVAVKGAFERLREAFDPEKKNEMLADSLLYAESGYRIIAVGGGFVDKISPPEDLPRIELFGFVALIDPLRPEARQAVSDCHRAGVEVAMVTGDHPATSLAIAKEVGIARSENELITGSELLSGNADADFMKVIAGKRVFSRVSPQQKQLIVQTLRDSGHFIAVTGDGVNDAPALKTANIGVAMGYGTDVAKETSSIIISDNNFASIAAGIEEGRFAYSNLRKIIYLLISTGAAELVTIALALVFQLPLPFLPVQLLWLNLVTNGIQDVGLAFEAGEKSVMRDPPRKPEESVIDSLMIQQSLLSGAVISLLAFGLWFHLLQNLGWSETEARNTVLMLMVLLQNFHTLNCRSETQSLFALPFHNNYFLVLGIIAAQSLHIAALHIPVMQDLLSLSPIPPGDWLKLFLTASVIVVVMEVFKRFKGARSRAAKVNR